MRISDWSSDVCSSDLAMGLPDIRYPDGREIAPQLDMREQFELFAGVRPVKILPGAPACLADPRARALDFVLIRESTEGLFAGTGQTRVEAQAHPPTAAHDGMMRHHPASAELYEFTFQVAPRR